MDGIHDLGGMDGFGAFEAEPDEPVFHHTLGEACVFAMSMAMARMRRLEHRHRAVRHRVVFTGGLPVQFVLRKMVQSHRDPAGRIRLGVRGRDRERHGRAVRGKRCRTATFTADRRRARAQARRSFAPHPQAEPLFASGDRVRARNMHPRSHTRLARYVRGHVGVVERFMNANVFPDSIVRGEREKPQSLHTVRFDCRELWGDDAEPGTDVSIDAFEPYLEPA